MMNRYYEGGVSSVYFWDLDDGFAGVVLLKKSRLNRVWHGDGSNEVTAFILMPIEQRRPRARVKGAGIRYTYSRLLTELARHTTSLRVQ